MSVEIPPWAVPQGWPKGCPGPGAPASGETGRVRGELSRATAPSARRPESTPGIGMSPVGPLLPVCSDADPIWVAALPCRPELALRAVVCES